MAFGHGLQPHDAKHNRNLRLMAIVGVGALALFLFIRSRSSSTATPAVDPTTGASTDAAGTPSTFADNGAQAAQLGDAVSTGLAGVGASLDQLTQADQALAGSLPSTAAPTDGSAASAAGMNTLTNAGLASVVAAGAGAQNKAAAPSTRPKVGSSAGPHGALVAPSGPRKPPAKPGYNTVGTGHGGWVYVPKQTTTSKPAPKATVVANHGGASHANHAKAPAKNKRR